MRHTEPEYAALTPELKQRLERFRQEHCDDPVGGVANTLLYEDESVRVWEMNLEPGEHSDLHHHAVDYLLVIDSGDLVAGIPPLASGLDPFVGVVPALGNTVRVPAGGTEWALNVGQETYHEILIELKQAAPPVEPNPIADAIR
jgi:hypothetical protein